MQEKFNKFILMRLYLFGKYCGSMGIGAGCSGNLLVPEKKNLENAINLIPDYFKSIYSPSDKEREEMEFLFTNEMIGRGYYLECYLPDIELQELIVEMRDVGYTEEEISRFATRFIEWLLSFEKIFYSSMYLRLFGQHSSGVEVNIPNIKNFEDAISLIPEYITFITSVYESNYIEGTADPVEILCDEYIRAMRLQNFSEEEQLRFISVWVDEVEAQGKMSLALMEIYLTGKVTYKGDDFVLVGKQNFGKALAIIPEYLQYLIRYSHPCWDDGVGYYPTRWLNTVLIPRLRESEYLEQEIESFRLKFLEEVESQGIYEPDDAECDERVKNYINNLDSLPF